MNACGQTHFGLRLAFYGVAASAVGTAAYLLPDLLLGWFQPITLGACAVTVFAALYFGELKQESVGQLYQALAASSLKTRDMIYFHDHLLAKVRTIRKLLLWSNLVKLVGAVAALYLWNEKGAPKEPGGLGAGFLPPDMAKGALLVVVIALGVSIILFGRLWSEVTNAENALIAAREDALIKQKARDFVAESKSAPAHNFEDDQAAQAVHKKPEKVKLSALT